MVQDESRMRYAPELYFKFARGKCASVQGFPGRITNTLATENGVMSRSNSENQISRVSSAEDKRRRLLRELCTKVWKNVTAERAKFDNQLRERLAYELSVLEKTVSSATS